MVNRLKAMLQSYTFTIRVFRGRGERWKEIEIDDKLAK